LTGPAVEFLATRVRKSIRRLPDTLFVRGVEIRHIVSAATPKPHELSEFARESEGRVIYPGVL